MSELSLLRVLLLLSLAVAPLGTHRAFLSAPSPLGTMHLGALACAAVGIWSPAPIVGVVWLLFCAGSFALFLRSKITTLRTAKVLAACVPFLFSNIAAVWLVAGANDLRLLGYDTTFSYYAALHGSVLGWTMLGALAVLANRDGPQQRVYLVSVFVCFVSFLLIAFGIDQLRALKLYGVIGLSIALALSQLAFLRSVWKRNPRAFAAGCVSAVGLVVTMFLAWRNELLLPALSAIAGVRSMVSVHGTLNALIVAPCFLLAVALDAREPHPTSKSQRRPSRSVRLIDVGRNR